MKIGRLILSLAFFVPAFALFGAFAAYDNHERSPWLGVSIGAVIGVILGLVFGGVQGRWLDAILGQEERYDEIGEGREEYPYGAYDDRLRLPLLSLRSLPNPRLPLWRRGAL